MTVMFVKVPMCYITKFPLHDLCDYSCAICLIAWLVRESTHAGGKNHKMVEVTLREITMMVKCNRVEVTPVYC